MLRGWPTRERVGTKGEIIEVADYLDAYVVEWTLHHLDLIAHLPHVPGPPDDSLAASREALGEIVGASFPDSFSDVDALLVGTGRRVPTEAEGAALVGNRLSAPVSLG